MRHADVWLERLLDLQQRIRVELGATMQAQSAAQLARRAREAEGDTIFAIDVAAERILLEACERWSEAACFVLVAEGIEPSSGRLFGRPGSSGPEFRLIVDPIDGTRGLMWDKRSAWSLAAIAPDRGPGTRLTDLVAAAMSELPTTRQAVADQLWAVRGRPAEGRRCDLRAGTAVVLPVVPSTAIDLRDGFATVCNYFPGGKERIAQLDERLIERVHGPWNPSRAEIYSDQYISSGGQLAELALGRDRLVLDVRPLAHRALGIGESLCSKPYDLCTALVAQAAGCVVTAPDGSPLDAPLDVTTNVAWVGYCNQALAARVQPHLSALLAAW
jgi:hypothetical protein